MAKKKEPDLKEIPEVNGKYNYTRINAPKGFSIFLDRIREKKYPNMFKSHNDFAVFLLRKFIVEFIDKDPDIAKDFDLE